MGNMLDEQTVAS
jgi:hypothetical protein